MAQWSKWREETDADILDATGFADWKTAGARFVVGVMGFSGAWRRSGLSGKALQDHILDAELALSRQLVALKDTHADRLVMCSGATNTGVPGLAYSLCTQHQITGAGITAGAALRYRLGEMAVLVVVGKRFGDESAVFVQSCDAFLLLGGGKQSAKECRMAAAAGKPITVIQGFGGVADGLTGGELQGARFVKR